MAELETTEERRSFIWHQSQATLTRPAMSSDSPGLSSTVSPGISAVTKRFPPGRCTPTCCTPFRTWSAEPRPSSTKRRHSAPGDPRLADFSQPRFGGAFFWGTLSGRPASLRYDPVGRTAAPLRCRDQRRLADRLGRRCRRLDRRADDSGPERSSGIRHHESRLPPGLSTAFNPILSCRTFDLEAFDQVAPWMDAEARRLFPAAYHDS